MPARLAALSMATWNRGCRTTLLERRASLATTWAGMSRHQMIDRLGISGGSCDGVLDGRGEVPKFCQPAFERETEAVGRGLRSSGQLGIVGLGEIDQPP